MKIEQLKQELDSVYKMPSITVEQIVRKDEALKSLIDKLEGHALVPLEPTEEMLKEIWLDDRYTYRAIAARYKAMIQASQEKT